jgi:hypothetical protein
MIRKKKIIVAGLLAAMTVCGGVLFASCDIKSASNDSASGNSTITEHVHNYGEWTEKTKATCTEDGEEIRVCAEDATHTESRATERLGHNYEKGVCTHCNEADPDYQAVGTEGLEFTLNDAGTEYSVTGYKGSSSEVVIPTLYNDLPVTSIGDSAFGSCRALTSVEIPNSVTSIGEYAFADCTALESVTIPENVTRIGYDAFSYCSNLTRVIFKNPSGWWYSCDREGTDKTDVASSDLEDPTTAASYLVRKHDNYYWNRG